MYIDSHSHLFYPNFSEDINVVIQNASANLVEYILVPATNIVSCLQTIELTNKFNNIFGAVGIHPHDTKEWEENIIGELKTLSKNQKIVAIGEIGLDYYYDFSPKETQIKAFRSQIELAIELNLPIIVHNREADNDILNIIREYKSTSLKGQFHCFNGNLKDALELIEMGHYVSFTGNITFKKADNLREIVKEIPINNLLLETDSPFMTPVPFRGKRNEPAYVRYVAKQIAEVKNISEDKVGNITLDNFFKLFSKAKR